MNDRLLCGAEAIGAPWGLTANKVYKLAEKQEENGFPVFRITSGPRGRLYARPQDIERWLDSLAAGAKGDDYIN